MGEEDDFDLDDDLGLDDDGDDGMGSLDSEMDDDDAGLDAGGDAGETELDSFFEDLSSIDDSEPEPAAAAPAAAPAAAAPAPAAAAAAPAAAAEPGKKGGMMKIIGILVVLLGLAGGGWFYMNQPQDEFATEEAPMTEESIEPIEEKLVLEMDDEPAPQPRKKKVVVRVPLPPPAPEPIVEPVRATPRFLVQVGSCSFERCKKEFSGKIRNMGEPVHYRSSGEKFDFISLITKQVFGIRDAENWVRMINQSNERVGVASIVKQSNGYRVSMGTFTSLEKAKSLKIYLESLFPKEGLALNLEHMQQDYKTVKIFAGPYSTKREAKQTLNSFRRQKEFTGAFITRY